MATLNTRPCQFHCARVPPLSPSGSDERFLPIQLTVIVQIVAKYCVTCISSFVMYLVLGRMTTGGEIVRQYKMRKLRHNTPQLQLVEGKIEGRRSPGRPRTTWITELANNTGAKYYQLKRAAEDRKRWHSRVVNLRQEKTLR